MYQAKSAATAMATMMTTTTTEAAAPKPIFHIPKKKKITLNRHENGKSPKINNFFFFTRIIRKSIECFRFQLFFFSFLGIFIHWNCHALFCLVRNNDLFVLQATSTCASIQYPIYSTYSTRTHIHPRANRLFGSQIRFFHSKQWIYTEKIMLCYKQQQREKKTQAKAK